MDEQRTLGSPINAIPSDEIEREMTGIMEKVKRKIVAAVKRFTSTAVTPLSTMELEELLVVETRELGREVLERTLNVLEPNDVAELPPAIEYQSQSHYRLAETTPNPNIVTHFGRITLSRARYRNGRRGHTIFPLEIALGIDEGFTPAAADVVGRQFATCGSSQGRTIEAFKERTGVRIGAEKLRSLVDSLATGMEPHRQETQLEQLMIWINEARKAGETPVISVSRDGVSLGICSLNSFEMASVATITIMSEGEKRGTVYLGRAPEANQSVLSDQLTSLLTATVIACGKMVPEIIYVTDAGKVETAYWKNVLRKFFVNGRRIRIQRVLDYYHASERLTKIANALKFGRGGQRRDDWLREMRKLLLKKGGWGRVMRSIGKMKALYGYKRDKKSDAEKAEKYLRRYQRFMNYHHMRAQGFPIGSGIVESACKQVVSERLKLSGMRWEHAGAQQTISLRCILLSGIWHTIYQKRLEAKPPVVAQIRPNAA